MKNNIYEGVISKTDIKSILKTASALRDKSTLAGKMFKELRKDKIDVADLQKAWIEAGRPDDTIEIAAILKDKFGFSSREIKKVFSEVFGSPDSENIGDEETITPALQKIVDYCKEYGLVDDLKAFLEKEYGEELGLEKSDGMFNRLKGFFGKKAVMEDIRQIFEKIVHEERHDRFKIIKQLEQTQLGRTKK